VAGSGDAERSKSPPTINVYCRALHEVNSRSVGSARHLPENPGVPAATDLVLELTDALLPQSKVPLIKKLQLTLGTIGPDEHHE
jgi:hypothetical protein